MQGGRGEEEEGEKGGQNLVLLISPITKYAVHCTVNGVLSKCNQLAAVHCHYQLSTYLSTAVCP